MENHYLTAHRPNWHWKRIAHSKTFMSHHIKVTLIMLSCVAILWSAKEEKTHHTAFVHNELDENRNLEQWSCLRATVCSKPFSVHFNLLPSNKINLSWQDIRNMQFLLCVESFKQNIKQFCVQYIKNIHFYGTEKQHFPMCVEYFQHKLIIQN